MITRLLEQHLGSLDPGARQPRLAMIADGQANSKTHERTEGADTAAVLHKRFKKDRRPRSVSA